MSFVHLIPCTIPLTLPTQYEQIRLCGAAGVLQRNPGTTPQPLTIKSPTTGTAITYLIPPQTYATVNFAAVHCDPNYWGEDVLEWNPKRWIRQSSQPTATTATDLATTLSTEVLTPPPSATLDIGSAVFIGWSTGPRTCPGKKSSQVQFVAVMSYLLRRHRVRIVKLKGESESEAQKRVLSVVGETEFTITPKMMRPETVRLEWVER